MVKCIGDVLFIFVFNSIFYLLFFLEGFPSLLERQKLADSFSQEEKEWHEDKISQEKWETLEVKGINGKIGVSVWFRSFFC